MVVENHITLVNTVTSVSRKLRGQAMDKRGQILDGKTT